MALQKTVNLEYAAGVAGDMVNPGAGQNVYTPVNMTAQGEVKVGSFVFPGADPYRMASNSAQVVSAGADTYAVSAGDATGTLSIIGSGADITAESTIGAASTANMTATGATVTLSVPVASGFSGDVKVGAATVTVADGAATVGTTASASGTNSKLMVTAAALSGNDVVITMTAEWSAQSTASAVVGFVQRVQQYTMYNILQDGTLIVADGDALSVAVRGDYYAVSSTESTIGQAVFASTADGSVSTGEAGKAVSGAVETGWVVKNGGAAGDIIVIGRQ
ncbi:MAG: hypothetical protein NC112_08990 [Oxalobacter formigenes]|nr:hypothetical protein [Oxalobacter formigenes]